MVWAWWRHPSILRRVYVHLIAPEDVTIEGVLWAYRGPWLVLREVIAHRENLPAKPSEGEVIIDRRNVAFLTVL